MTFPQFSWRTLARALLVISLGWLPAVGAHAAVSCTAEMSALNFGTVDLVDGSTPAEASATLSYECTNDALLVARTRVCFNIGDGNQSLGFFSPRRMTAGGSDVLPFQIYHGTTTIWGSNGNATVPFPFAVDLNIPAIGLFGPGRSAGTATLRGVLAANPGGIASGAYQNDFYGVHTSISYTSATFGSMPTTCTTSLSDKFGFVASANVAKGCVVSATALNFGTVDGLPGSANIDGQTSVNVTCSRTTAYNVTLTPANGNANGTGAMTPLAGGSDTIAYRLYSNPGRTVTWGNVTGNRVSGTGSGAAQVLPVYARVLGPGVNVTPGSYQDVVTVRVDY